ncbi:MAG: YcbK family protein [Paracoccaceae bacterium]
MIAGVQIVLQAFRGAVGAPVRITNVYRSPAYNDCVGGKPGSQHKEFRAADIFVPGAGNPRQWRDILRKLRREGVFRGGIGTYGSFVHVDTRGVNADWTG